MIPAKKIIIAEDNRADVELFKFCMDESPVAASIVHMADGKALIDYIETTPLNDTFFILLDMHLPGMDGFEILDHLKEKGYLNGPPVLTISSLPGQSFLSDCLAHGSTEHYLKPTALDQYEEMVMTMLQRWCN
ncbi:MAG: response regulator [Cyanothece sp. SIO1E1]|jgi:CheY-like chemotaxis protein|nr:response regulator [Cyanothece sp. SIO1E1]